MPTETYHVDYTGDSSSAVAAGRSLEAVIQALESRLAAIKSALTGVFTPGGRSAAAMARQVTELNAQLAAMQGQLAGAATSLGTLNIQTNVSNRSFMQLRLTMMALREVEQVLKAIGDGLHAAEERANALAEKNLKLRDSMRELANLQGKSGPDDQVTGEAFKLGLAAGMKPSEAVDFLTQFEGSIPAGRQKGNIGTKDMTDEQKLELEKQIARVGASFGTRIGVDAKTMGDLAGVIPQHTKIDKVETFAGHLGGLAYGLNEGRGQMTPLMRQELGAAGNAIGSNRIKDLPELGAVIGVASTLSKSAGTSGNIYRQMSNALNRSTGQEGDFLQSIGVDKADGDIAKLKIMRDHLSQFGGKDPNRYLAEKGFGSQEERGSLVAMAGQYDLITHRSAKARGMIGQGAQVMAQNDEFLNTTVLGQSRKAEAAKEAAEFIQGREREEFTDARKAAEARLWSRGELDTASSNLGDSLFDSTIGLLGKQFFGAPGRRQERIDAEATSTLFSEAERVGVDIPGEYKTASPHWQAKAFRDFAPEVASKGGNPYGDQKGVEDRLDKLIELQRQRDKQPPLPPPLPPGGQGGAAPGRAP